MSLSKQQILKRLRSTTQQDFLNSPYFRHSKMPVRKLTALLNNLESGGDDLKGELRPLLLMSVSIEIQSLAGNFSGNGSTISDKEASARAKVFANDLIRNARSKPIENESDGSKPIQNKARFPYVDWLDEARTVGTIAGTPLVLLGHEQGTDDPIVSRDIRNDPYFATPISELMSHSQDPINITGSLDRNSTNCNRTSSPFPQ